MYTKESRVKATLFNDKQIRPALLPSCVACYNFEGMQKNEDIYKNITMDFSGNKSIANHTMSFTEKDYSNTTAHYTVVNAGNIDNRNVYRCNILNNDNDSSGYSVTLNEGLTIGPNKAIYITLYVKYTGNATKRKPMLVINKNADANGSSRNLKTEYMNETITAELDKYGYTKMNIKYVNDTETEVTNVSTIFYFANATGSNKKAGEKPETYFYIKTLQDGVTSLRSGWF